MKKINPIVLLFSLLTGVVAVSSLGKGLRSDPLFSEGVELYRSGRYAEAARLFAEADSLDRLDMDSTSSRCFYSRQWLASCHYRMGDESGARAIDKDMYRFPPVDRRLTAVSDSLSDIADKYMAAGRFAEAREIVDSVFAIEGSVLPPDHYLLIGTNMMKADCMGGLQRFDEALAFLEESRRLVTLNYGPNSIRHINVLFPMYYFNLQLGNVEEAIRLNDRIKEVLDANGDPLHQGYAEYAFNKVMLALMQHHIPEARAALPQYVEALRKWTGNDMEKMRQPLGNMRGILQNCGMQEDVAYIDNLLTASLPESDPKAFFNSLMMKYNSDIASKDDIAAYLTEQKLYQTVERLAGTDREESLFMMECMRCMRYMSKGDLETARKLYLALEEMPLAGKTSKGSDLHQIYMTAKSTMSLVFEDYEGAIEGMTEVVESMDSLTIAKNTSIYANFACWHALAGKYGKARELAQKAVRAYRKYAVEPKAIFRLDKDTAEINRVADNIQSLVRAQWNTHDSVTYTMRDIKSEFLLLKCDLMRNLDRHVRDPRYYDCVADYAFELSKMSKYMEARDAMNAYLREWKECYDALGSDPSDKDAPLDKVVMRMTLGDALEFRRRKCYDKGDPEGAAAHKDFIAYVKEESGEDSDDYVNAMVDYYRYIDDKAGLVNFLAAKIEDDPESFSPRAFSDVAEALEETGDRDRALLFRKGFVISSLYDEQTRDDNWFVIFSKIKDILKQCPGDEGSYAKVREYYEEELWPMFEDSGVPFAPYFLNSVNELSFIVDDDSFVVPVEAMMERKKKDFGTPGMRCAAWQTIAGVLAHSHDQAVRGRAIEYIDKALREVEGDPVLRLLMKCRKHEVYSLCGEEYNLDAIALGTELLREMEGNSVWRNSHEYEMTVERQIEFLQNEGRYEDVFTLCRTYLDAYGNRDTDHLTKILNEEHPEYDGLQILNCTILNDWSYDTSLSEVNDALYTAGIMQGDTGMEDVALERVRDGFRGLDRSIGLNTVGSWECDNLISLTSKLAYRHQCDSLNMRAYDAALLCKGLQLRSDHAVRAIILKSGHKNALRKYDELQHTMRCLTTADDAQLDSLQKRRKTLEEDLFRLSKSFGDFSRSLRMSWKDVRNALGDNDLAVEFTSVSLDYQDKYVCKDSTLAEGYYACVLRKDMDRPAVVFVAGKDGLPAGQEIYSDPAVTRTLLTPLKPYLKGIRNLYFSPIGNLNRISIESLPLEDDPGKTLSSRYNVCRLSSTRELVENPARIKGSGAVVYGGLEYDMTVESMVTDAEAYPEVRDRDLTFAFSHDVDGIRVAGDDIPYLAGSKTEAENVAQVYNGGGDDADKARLVEGQEGTETSFKALSGKQKKVLHIATHGFYFNEAEASGMELFGRRDGTKMRGEDRSLMRSGLLMAGAGNRYMGEVLPDGLEDGILTSQEIANTDLTGLDLCVLSACQTAEGDISSEGVFGLQRGFKKAGANTLLMSLWKVDDDATCLLMTEFYRNWISKGETKQQALEHARLAVRSHTERGWDHPRYWASFILLDALD